MTIMLMGTLLFLSNVEYTLTFKFLFLEKLNRNKDEEKTDAVELHPLIDNNDQTNSKGLYLKKIAEILISDKSHFLMLVI